MHRSQAGSNQYLFIEERLAQPVPCIEVKLVLTKSCIRGKADLHRLQARQLKQALLPPES